MFDKQPLHYHGQEFICFLAEKGGRSGTGSAWAPDAKPEREGKSVGKGWPPSRAAGRAREPPLCCRHLRGVIRAPPRPPPPQKAVGLASEAITSGAILGLLPNHLEYLIRGKLRCPEQFWFPIPHSRARVNPKLPSREKRRWQTLSCFNPAHSFEDKNLTNKQPQPLPAGHPPLKYCHLTCLSLPETRELIKTLCLIKKQWSIKANRTASHLLLQFCLHKLQLVCKQGHWWEIGNAPFPGHCLLPHPSFIQLFERGSAKARWGFTRLQSCTQLANSELERAN